MRKASITEAKNQLSALLEVVKRGESVLIMDRNRAVARLEPVSTESDAETEAWIRELERSGLARRPRLRASKVALSGPIPKAASSIVDALLADREEGR